VANVSSNNIYGCSIDARSGGLILLAGSPFSAGDQPEGVAAAATGKFASVVSSGTGNVSGCAADAGSGTLKPVKESPFAAGYDPHGSATRRVKAGKFIPPPGDEMSTLKTPPVSRRGILEFAASFGVLAAIGTPAAGAAPREGVVGAWSLVSFDTDEGAGSSKPRFGPDPVGYLLYTADGHMAAVLAGTHRPELKSPSGSSATEAQRTQALANFLAYAGRYDVRGDRVFHHVEVSVFTNLMGTTLERQFKIAGDMLTIRTVPPEIWGSSNILVWKRA
jgi:hypothetical protein